MTWPSSTLSNWSICVVNWLFSTPPAISFPHLFLSTNSQSDYPPGLANNINRVADCLTVCTNIQLHTKLTYKLLCTFNAYGLPKYRYAPHTMQPTCMRGICETRTSTRLYHTPHPLQYIHMHTCTTLTSTHCSPQDLSFKCPARRTVRALAKLGNPVRVRLGFAEREGSTSALSINTSCQVSSVSHWLLTRPRLCYRFGCIILNINLKASNR